MLWCVLLVVIAGFESHRHMSHYPQVTSQDGAKRLCGRASTTVQIARAIHRRTELALTLSHAMTKDIVKL